MRVLSQIAKRQGGAVLNIPGILYLFSLEAGESCFIASCIADCGVLDSGDCVFIVASRAVIRRSYLAAAVDCGGVANLIFRSNSAETVQPPLTCSCPWPYSKSPPSSSSSEPSTTKRVVILL